MRDFPSGVRFGYSTGREFVHDSTDVQLLYVTKIRRRMGEGAGKGQARNRAGETGHNRVRNQGSAFGKDAYI